MTIGENIRRIRLEKGLTQKQVAQACGTADAYIRAYESGRYNPKPATVAKIAKALGVTPAELYGRGGDGELDPYTEFAIYQAENGGEVDETAVNMQQLLTTAVELSHKGQEILVNLAKELTFVPALGPPQTVADVLGGLSGEEQSEILRAYQALQRAELEKRMMDESGRKTPGAIHSNTKIINDRKNDILEVILAALDRSGLFDSGK